MAIYLTRRSTVNLAPLTRRMKAGVPPFSLYPWRQRAKAVLAHLDQPLLVVLKVLLHSLRAVAAAGVPARPASLLPEHHLYMLLEELLLLELYFFFENFKVN